MSTCEPKHLLTSVKQHLRTLYDCGINPPHLLFETTSEELEQVKKNNRELKFKDFKSHLARCGSLARVKWYCKQCENEEQEALLKDSRIYQHCGIRYCEKHNCILSRFSQQINSLKSIDRLKNLRKMEHFVIGFEPLTKGELINSFDLIKKRYEKTMNLFFSRLRKKGFKLQSFKVLDIALTPKEDKYYIHYHFIAIPVHSNKKRLLLIQSQQIRKSIIDKQKIKTPFHIQFFGLKSKPALFSYLSIRAIGLYKFHDDKEKGYNIKTEHGLRNSLEQGKFMLLKDIVPIEFYYSHFYNRRHFSTIGSLPYGSIIMDNLPCKYPNFCKIHGHLERNQLRRETIYEDPYDSPPKPPNLACEPPTIEVIHLGGPKPSIVFEAQSYARKYLLEKYGTKIN